MLDDYSTVFFNKFFVLLIALASSYSLSSQINIKVGYTPSWGSFKSINSSLETYNNINQGKIESEFGDLNFLHGLDIGLRYKISNVGFELGWTNMNRDRDALIHFDQSDTFESRVYKFGLNSFSFGTDLYLKNWGLGVAILSQKLNITREIGSNKLTLTSERNYNLDLHLNLIIQQGKSVTFIARPFFRYSLDPYDISGFTNDLIDENSSFADIQTYGLSLVFFNGKN